MVNLKNKLKPYPVYCNTLVNVPEPTAFQMPPMFAGTMNNWEYSPMVKIEEFLMMMDPNFVEPFTQMKANSEINETLTKLEELSRFEMKAYIRNRMKMVRNYKQNWLVLLLKTCDRFKNPCLLNLAEFDNFPSPEYIEKEEIILKAMFPKHESE